MTTFVLVHGSFHGGWCWQKVEQRLTAAGHEVYTPTLTGLGERSHLASPRSGLELHVRDVVQVFEYEDLTGVVLVGHSYGGLVITGVAEHCVDRIAGMVYLDGYLPEDGQSAWDITPDGKERWERWAEESGAGWLVPPVDPAEYYEITDVEDLAWLRDNLVATPLLTHEEPLRVPQERSKELPRSYIACARYDTFEHMAEKARDKGLDYHELDTGHDAMVSMPEELSEILLKAAETAE